MDFRRIEAIFLVVFIALDIFLFASYRQGQNVIVSNQNSNVTSIASEMRDSNISMNKLSSKKNKGYYLAGKPNNGLDRLKSQLQNQNVTVNNGILVSELKNPLDVRNRKVSDVLKKFVSQKNNVLYGNEYVYNPLLSNDKDYVFTQKGSFGNVFDNAAQITFTKQAGYINTYQQTYIDKLSVLREEQTTISEREAVNNLYTASQIPDNSKIKWTKFAYSRLLVAKGNVIYIPTWYICIKSKSTNNKTIKVVNAFNGTMMKNQQQEEK